MRTVFAAELQVLPLTVFAVVPLNAVVRAEAGSGQFAVGGSACWCSRYCSSVMGRYSATTNCERS